MTERTPNIRFTFSSDERLKSKKEIDLLFRQKLFIQNSSFRIYYLSKNTAEQSISKFAFSVSKKSFPKSVDRNRIKRMMREAVRLNKQGWNEKLSARGLSCNFLLVCKYQEIPDYTQVEKGITLLFAKLTASLL